MFEYIKQFDINKIFYIVLLLSLGSTLALFINSYLELKFFSLPPATIKPVNIEKKKQKDYSKIAYIFQEFQDVPKKLEEKKEKKKKTVISTGTSVGNLTLVGTVILNKEKYALIKAGSEPKIVKIGSHINNFKVEGIGKFYVILSKGDKRYKLTVKINTSGTKYTKHKQTKTVINRSKSSSIETYKLDRRFVEQQTADIGKLLKDVFIVPVVRNGETVGFKFRYVKPGSLLYKYGFRSGDLILSINGKPIRTVEEAFKIYNILRNENLVKIEIERRGKVKTIVYEIQ